MVEGGERGNNRNFDLKLVGRLNYFRQSKYLTAVTKRGLFSKSRSGSAMATPKVQNISAINVCLVKIKADII